MKAAIPKNDIPRCDIDFRSAHFAQDPYSTYKLLREHYPVCLTTDDIYVLSRYEDVKLALHKSDVFASGWAAAPIAHPKWLRKECQRGHFLSELDPPEHTQHNLIIKKALVGQAIDNLIPQMKIMAQSHVNRIRQSIAIDFLEDFAYPLVGSMLDKVIGLNTGQNTRLIREWIDISESLTSQCPTPERQAQIEAIILGQNASYDALIRERREHPRDDVASLLANATISDQKLPDSQLHGAFNTFTLGGFDAPTQMLANAIILLSRRPDLAQLLRNQPQQIRPFIEELLRINNTTQGTMRMTTQSVTLHNVTIPPGSMVLALIASANRDPAQFIDPDEFMLARPNIKTHVGFGHGVHACIGAALARAEINVVLETLLNTFKYFDCPPDDELKWVGTVVGRVLRSLPVRLQ